MTHHTLPPHQAPIDEILCALLFLLSRQARSPGVDLTTMIRDHLLWLAHHPEAVRLALVRKIGKKLATQWQGLGAEGVGSAGRPVPGGRATLH